MSADQDDNKRKKKMTTIEAGDRVVQIIGKFIRSGTVQSVNRGISNVEWDNGQESFETDLYKAGDKIFCEHLPWLGWAEIDTIGAFGLEVLWPAFLGTDYYSYHSINKGGWLLSEA